VATFTTAGELLAWRFGNAYSLPIAHETGSHAGVAESRARGGGRGLLQTCHLRFCEALAQMSER